MQIGKGKQGVLIGEYGFSRPQDKKAQTQDGCGFLGWIEPACDNPQWIMWFDEKGNAQLYTDREIGLEPKYHEKNCLYHTNDNSPCTCGLPNKGLSGATLGDPIRIKARGRNRKTGGAPQASITGNMEIGRATIRGEEYLTLKVDKNGGNLKHVWPDGDANEIVFGGAKDGHDYEGRNPNDCVNLVGRNQTIILVNRVD